MPVGRRACSLYYACVAASLLFCITPVGQQACSSVLRLCGGMEKKKKKKERRSFVACVAVSLKLVVCITPVGRRKKKREKKNFLLPVWL